MSTAVYNLKEPRLQAFLNDQLNCDASFAATRAALIADHIRTQVWAPHSSILDGSSVRRVHTARISSALRRNLRALFRDADGNNLAEEEFSFVRAQLELAGDIVHVGDGYWIPGPMRLVLPQNSPAVIILGGMPNAALRSVVRGDIHCVGPLRYISVTALTSTHPPETVADWLGSLEGLGTWTERILAWASRRLTKQADIEDHSIEIYAPDAFRAQGRLGYWMEVRAFRDGKRMLRLFRPIASQRWAFGRPNFLGVLTSRSEGSQVTRAVRIEQETAYRLQFGLDAKLQTSRSISFQKRNQAWEIDLRFDLPAPEKRVLGFSWRESPESPTRLLDDVGLLALRETVGMLGMTLQRRQVGG